MVSWTDRWRLEVFCLRHRHCISTKRKWASTCIRHGTQTFTYLHSLKNLHSLVHKTRERQLHTTIRLFSDVCAPRLTTTVSSTSSSCHCLFVRSYRNEGDILITTVVRDSARQSRMLVDIRVAAKQAERLMYDASRRHCRYHGVRSCLLYTSPSPRDATLSRMPSSA